MAKLPKYICMKVSIEDDLTVCLDPVELEEVVADLRPARPCDGCPFCICEKYGVICPSDPDFRCDTRGDTDG